MPLKARRKVLFLESAAAMGGVQFSTLYLAQTLHSSRWDTIVVAPAEGDLTNACRAANVETQVISWPRLWSTSVRIGGTARLPNLFAWIRNTLALLRATRSLKKFLRHNSPDVVVTKGLASHFIGGFAARGLDIPCVWHVQDLISERSFAIYRRIFGVAARRLPQHIVVDGAAIKEQLPASIQSRVSVIHNGVDTNVFRPGRDGSTARREFGISSDQIVIGHAGRITPWKGQHYLIEAFARIASKHPNVTLLFAGAPIFDNDIYQRRLQTMAADFGLQDRIKFVGYRHDLPDVLAAMDIFAFTSIEKDTSPLALVSAMATGLPIVAFEIAGVKELMSPNECLLTPVAHTEAFADSLSSLILDEAARRRFGANARQKAIENLSLDGYVSSMEQILLAVGSKSSGDSKINLQAGIRHSTSRG